MKSKRIIVMLLLIVIMLGLSTISNAALESRPGKNSWNATANNLFTSIRAMEKSGGTLGLNATIDGTKYLDTTGNGLDVHMALATEWGTAALLAVSDYGAYNTYGIITDSGTNTSATTGNITGIYQMADISAEYVSGMLKDSSNSNTDTIFLADSRYRNEYNVSNPESLRGDALYQTNGWSSAGEVRESGNIAMYYRNGSLFKFSRFDGSQLSFSYGVSSHARAAITCAEGL